jgi:hypothetical protein
MAQEIYQKQHPGEQILVDQKKEYAAKAKSAIEEEYIQSTKDLRMEYFNENSRSRLPEMERRYNNIEQYFRSRAAA